MARSIVLRFDATCFDCGSPIPAGTTARWFGRGRVSCCGSARPAGAAPAGRQSSPAPRAPAFAPSLPACCRENLVHAGRPACCLPRDVDPCDETAVAAALRARASSAPIYVRCRRCGRYGSCTADACAPAVPSSTLPPRGVPVPLSSMLPPEPQRMAEREHAAAGDGPRFGEHVLDAELAAAVRCGLSSAQAARLAAVCPEQRLVVRLQSGARFVTTARDVQHLVACIEESLRDKVRDVMGAAS